jgi:hypothetical protein
MREKNAPFFAKLNEFALKIVNRSVKKAIFMLFSNQYRCRFKNYTQKTLKKSTKTETQHFNRFCL